MGNIWLKIKVWTKVAVVVLLLLYLIVFISRNSGQPVKLWFWFNYELETTVLPLVLWAFGTGVAGTVLVRTTFKTIRQVRGFHERGRAGKMQRELDDMKTKAGMLRPKPGPATADDAGREAPR